MPACAAFGCTNRPGKKIPGITFHRFPKNLQLRHAWITACRRKNWEPSSVSTLCSEHFTENQIDRTSLTIVRLRENAVPNVFKAFPSYLQKIPKKRKSPEKICTGIPPENCQLKNAPVSNLPLENKNEKISPKRQSERKRKFSGRTTSNKVNNNSEDCHLNNNQVTSSTENSIDKNHSLSNDSQSVPAVCIKIEEPWEEEYSYVGNSSGDKSKDCNKMLIEIRDVRSVVSNENKSSSTEIVDKNSEKISDSASILAKPLKVSKREETFGKFIASEISNLRENPELYRETKQAILNILAQAHFEQMKFN